MHFNNQTQLGITLRNPLNMPYTNKNWLGLDMRRPAEKGLCRFRNAVYCYRAAIIQLCKFVKRHEADTPTKIMELWLPGHGGIKENYYLPCVCGRSRIMPNEIISPEGMDIPRLLAAMARQETGTFITPEAIYDIRKQFDV